MQASELETHTEVTDEKPTQTKKARVHAYMDDLEAQGIEPTLTQTAKECGVSRALVSVVRAERKSAGKGKQRPRTPSQLGDDADALALFLADAEKAVGHPLDPDQQARVLSGIIRSQTVNSGTRISALNSLRELQRQQGTHTELGPGPPMTEEDAIDRLTRLMRACGHRIVSKAYTRFLEAPNDEKPMAEGGNDHPVSPPDSVRGEE